MAKANNCPGCAPPIDANSTPCNASISKRMPANHMQAVEDTLTRKISALSTFSLLLLRDCRALCGTAEDPTTEEDCIKFISQNS